MMLRLRLQANNTIVGWLDICNTGTGTEESGNYAIALLDQDQHALRHAVLEGYPRRLGAWELVRHSLDKLCVDELEKKFRGLTDLWKQETLLTSSFTDIVLNMAYQRIIGMGPAVVPLILRELEKRPTQWFWALHAITGEDPTMPEQQGRLREMANAWLKWGKDKGYL